MPPLVASAVALATPLVLVAFAVALLNKPSAEATAELLRKYGLENSVNVRQMGGTLEVAAAFQNRQIAGAVTGDLRVTPPSQPKILLQLIDLGIPYSMNMLAVSREMLKRDPDTAEKIVRAYSEGVAFMNQNKERALKIIAKYAHMTDPKQTEVHYRDSVTYLDRIPRAEPEAVQTILEFVGKKGVAPETFQALRKSKMISASPCLSI